jgi:hypothetical protein
LRSAGALDARHCPQCGLSVWLSLNDQDVLEWSRPEWLARLAWGAWTMAGAQLIGLASWVVFTLAYVFHQPLPIPTSLPSAEDEFDPELASRLQAMIRPSPSPKLLAISLAIGGLYFVVYHIGMLLLTPHEGRYPDRVKSHRLALLIMGIAGIAIGGIFLSCGGIAMVTQGGWLAGVFGIEFFVVIACAASVLTTWVFLRKLAQRVPSTSAARICGYLMLAPVIPLVKAAPILSAFLVSYIFDLVIRVIPWLYLPFTAGLLGWFALQFGKTSVSAVQNWAAESGPPGGLTPAAIASQVAKTL